MRRPEGTRLSEAQTACPRGQLRSSGGDRLPAQPATSTKKRPRRSEAFLSGGSRIRTGDPMLAKHVLYQLSYTPLRKKAGLVVRLLW